MRPKSAPVLEIMKNDSIAIALVSCAILMYQILMTRILSVVLWYHWAFLCVSLAMLGLGASGVWFALKKPGEKFLGNTLFLSGIFIPMSVVFIFEFGKLFSSRGVLVISIISIFPALLSLGAATCLILLRANEKNFCIRYGFDLAGAFVGALVVIPLMHLFQTPTLLALTSLLPLTALYIVDNSCRSRVVIMAGIILLLLLWGQPFRLTYSKAQEEGKKASPIYEVWTPMARITVFDSIFFRGAPGQAFGWGMGTRFQPVDRDQHWIDQDGSAGTPITRFKGNKDELSFLTFDVTNVVYSLRSFKSIAIVGPGGGRDILSAYYSGVPDIDAIELNPDMIKTLSKRFRDFSGDVYHLPGVHAVASEGRSYLTRTKKKFDLIQISLIDSWAATVAGAYALSENNLYTIEAFQLYLDRLQPDGILTISRWMKGSFHIEAGPLAVLFQEALKAKGVRNPERNIVAFRGGDIVTILASKAPFSANEMEQLKKYCAEKGFDFLYPKTNIFPGDNIVYDVLTHGPSVLASQGLRLKIATDDRPFFFHVLSAFAFKGRVFPNKYGVNGYAVFVLQLAMIIIGCLTGVTFFLPFFLNRHQIKRHAGFWRGNVYFTAIGLAFMFIEIPWIQKFILYLGHPSHAITVVLSCLLLGSGMGSLASAKIDLSISKRWGFVLPLVLYAMNAVLPHVFKQTIGETFLLRLAITWLLIFPGSFLMGFCFSHGMLNFGDKNKAWYWAMNGAAGVLASTLSLALAMEFGLSRVVIIGVICYVVAWFLLNSYSQRKV